MAAPRTVDHKLVAEVQKYAGARVHNFADDLTIYMNAPAVYTLKSEPKWLDRFDKIEKRLRLFVHEQRMEELQRLVVELALK